MPVLRPRTGQLGVVYTPREVAAPMVRLALEPLIRDRSATELAALRICDFAVGEGVFLEEAIALIADAMRARGVADPRTAAAACVVGVDIDAQAVATARRSIGGDLRVANALELDWLTAFPDVFARAQGEPARGGFDAVIGNPPYIRQESLTTKDALRRFASYDGVADLYVYFIELASTLLRPGGRFCLIAPNKWLTVEYGRKLRGFLAEQASVEQIIDLGRMPLFADADAFPCIVSGTAGTRHDHVRTGRAATRDVGAALAAPTGSLHRLDDGPWYLDAPAERALIERLEQRWPALGTLFPRPSRGVVTGCNRAFVIDRATRDRLLAEAPHSAPLIRPFVKGRDLRRWHTAPIDRYLLLIDRGTDLAAHPAIAAHLAQFREALEPRPPDHRGVWPGRKLGSYRWFELQDPVGEAAASRAPRLFYQDIQTGPACALDRSGELVPDTTVWILPTDDRCLLAILNSSLYGWYARQRFPPALNGATRPKLAYLERLPIATPTPRTRRAIESLVEARLVTPEPALDVELDQAVLDLYELTPAERRVLAR